MWKIHLFNGQTFVLICYPKKLHCIVILHDFLILFPECWASNFNFTYKYLTYLCSTLMANKFF